MSFFSRFSRLAEFFQEPGNNKLSSSRLQANLWAIGTLIIYSIVCIMKGEMVDVPASLITLVTIFVLQRQAQRVMGGEKEAAKKAADAHDVT